MHVEALNYAAVNIPTGIWRTRGFITAKKTGRRQKQPE